MLISSYGTLQAPLLPRLPHVLRCNSQEALSIQAIVAMCAQEYTAKLGALQAKGDDYDIAAAQVGVEVYSAMSAAVGQ